MLSQAEFEALPESSWIPYEVTQDYIRSYTLVDINGMKVRAERTQYLEDKALQDANREDYNDSDGKRWGDGRIVARVPLNVWFKELRAGVKAGDKDHMKWWLNRPENRGFRSFRGEI